jgi:hypothetical protein
VDLTLQRISQSPDCTMGMILLPNSELYTLELPWVYEANFPGGAPDRSCVRPGIYQLALHDTPHHPKSFALVNRALGVIHEPDPTFPNARVACLIHIGNFLKDLKGCLCVGTAAGECCVMNSAVAYGEFTAAVPWVEGHTLTIWNPPQGAIPQGE